MSFGKASRDVHPLTGSDNPNAPDYVKPTMPFTGSQKGPMQNTTRNRQQIPRAKLKQEVRHHRVSRLTPVALEKHLEQHGGRPQNILDHIPAGSAKETLDTTYKMMTNENEDYKDIQLMDMNVLNKPKGVNTRADPIPDKISSAHYDTAKFAHECRYAKQQRNEYRATEQGGNLDYLFGGAVKPSHRRRRKKSANSSDGGSPANNKCGVVSQIF